MFKDSILSLIKANGNLVFAVHDVVGLKFLTRLRLGFSHLNKHKFQYNFKGTRNQMCSCGAEKESTELYLLRRQI